MTDELKTVEDCIGEASQCLDNAFDVWFDENLHGPAATKRAEEQRFQFLLASAITYGLLAVARAIEKQDSGL